MDKVEIIGALKEIISPYTEEHAVLENINDNTDFIADLKINSANLVDIVLDIEEKFGITIDNDAMGKMLTVSATIEIINERLAGDVGQ
ncbi:acyl carrier protein [Pedobacter endophyticus]|uniref:Acyl carrier protein n=1 Tax=Pedobacter endophyticus TaxID=2789740 RepID=A0A7S9KZ74_9SPHI|nr:phosphopantetheine-binding protein [Pedobacter endophyticus]QPH39539.1 acyl carrier protein [Pedobacter endophyticus]